MEPSQMLYAKDESDWNILPILTARTPLLL